MFGRFEFFLEIVLEGLNSQKAKNLERGYIHFKLVFAVHVQLPLINYNDCRIWTL